MNLPGAVFSGRAQERRAAARDHLKTVCCRAGKAVPLVPDVGTILDQVRGSGPAGARALLRLARIRYLAAGGVLTPERLRGEAEP